MASKFPSVPLALLLALVARVTCLDNGLARTPPMGWVTWCTDNSPIPCDNDYCDENEVRSVVDAMVSNGMRELGYKHVNLDDCWAGARTANGTITADVSRFPSGTLKPLADYVHSKGFLLGLYTDVGTTTCKWGRPGSWGHYQQDALTYAAWGIDFVKMDWCDHPGQYNDTQLYTMMRDALNATGRPMVFSLCQWGLHNVWEWAAPIGNMWRVGPDHLPLWYTPNTTQDPGQGQGTANIIQHMATVAPYAGPGGWNDPDFLLPGYFWMGDIDRQTEFSFWCLFAAPLLVATDVRKLGPREVIMNGEAIAVNQDPLGIAGTIRSNFSDGAQVWSKPLSNDSWALIMYNSNVLEPRIVEVIAKWTPDFFPGWPAASTAAAVRDVWLHKDLGVQQHQFSSGHLVPHQSRMFVVKPA
eukprot:TRINITY_DN20099_c0_g1_i2.p1 TRINITY_DN20099_c0_g1~~TRINITY_DN20099_c0_g1_i2.p1  ORF type:complete len:413 (+),score=87.48 TRINITY_DN20099_c0_g1_i2:90-1328(+)